MKLLGLRAISCGVALAALACTAGACGAFGADRSQVTGNGDEGGADEGGSVGEGGVNADAAASDGGTDATVKADAGPFGLPCLGALACDRIVFVTHDNLTPDFGGVDAADTHCNLTAQASQRFEIKVRHFIAWLGDSTKAAEMRHVHGTGKYVRPDLVVIAGDWTALTSGTLLASISVDENGAGDVNDVVWTGTETPGAPPTGAPNSNTCSDWTTRQVPSTAIAGSSAATNASWSFASSTFTSCGDKARLYCIEQ